MNRRARPTLGYRVVAALVLLGERLLRWRIDAEGLEHVPDGGAVMTWNHTGHLDVVVTAVPLHRWTGRWPRFLALRDLWDRPVLGNVLRLVDCIPVERSSAAGGEALTHAVDALEDGDLVMVAPEGTISRSFELLPFHTGAARMAQQAGVPLVPTASWGSHRVATTGRSISWRSIWRLPGARLTSRWCKTGGHCRSQMPGKNLFMKCLNLLMNISPRWNSVTRSIA